MKGLKRWLVKLSGRVGKKWAIYTPQGFFPVYPELFEFQRLCNLWNIENVKVWEVEKTRGNSGERRQSKMSFKM